MGDIYTNPPQSRNEAILRATIDGVEYTAPPQSRIEDLLLELKAAIEGGGGGGTTVVPNPEGEPTADLNKVQIGSNVYGVLGELGTAAKKNSTNAVTEDSTDLVESGAVFDAVASRVDWDSYAKTGVHNLYDNSVTKTDIAGTTHTDTITGIRVTNSIANNYRGVFIPISIPKNTDITLSLSVSYTRGTGRFRVEGSNDDFATNTVIQDSDSSEITTSGEFSKTFNSGNYSAYRMRVNSSQATSEVGDITYNDIMLRYAEDTNTTFAPYAMTNQELTDNKTDNSVIAPVENGTTVQKSGGYAVGSHAIRNGAFITWKNAKAQGETIVDSDYDSGDVGSEFGLYIPIANNAGFHNSIFRGKNLGSSLTNAQKTAIANGTFEDMYIGDYWVINGVTWRIAHFDYWLKCGDTGGVGFCQTHHVVVVPDSVLNFKNMNDKVNNADVTTGAYINSKMYTTNIADGKNIVKAAFGENNILTKREYFANAVSNGYESGGAWVDSQIDLMNEKMVYGCDIFHNCINGTSFPHNYTIDKSQLALFRLDPSFIVALHTDLTDRAGWWLHDVVDATDFAFVGSNGNATNGGASSSLGVRPAFAIK